MASKVLIGTKAVCDYLAISRPTMYKLIEEGAPIRKGVGGWWSHADLLDEYFKRQLQNEKTDVK